MDLDQDYLEYVLEFSLALFAISAAYFIDLGKPITLGVLILIPVLFGYTAYISREKFQAASLMAFISLIFMPLNAILAAVAVTVSVGNTLVSFFAGGTRFKEYYSATMLPLLFTGLILGGSVYVMANSNPEFGNELRGGIAETVGNQTATLVEESNIAEMQQEANRQAVEQVSTGTIAATQGYVLNETQNDLSPQDQRVLANAFSSAQEEIPAQMLNMSENAQENSKVLDISGRVEGSIENLLSGNKILILVPIITFGMYGLQPVIGLLTAISARVFEIIGRREEDE